MRLRQFKSSQEQIFICLHDEESLNVHIEWQMLKARKNKKQYLEKQLCKHYFPKEKEICWYIFFQERNFYFFVVVVAFLKKKWIASTSFSQIVFVTCIFLSNSLNLPIDILQPFWKCNQQSFWSFEYLFEQSLKI